MATRPDIVMCREDPGTNPFAEVHTLSCPLDSATKLFTLYDVHRWWGSKKPTDIITVEESHNSMQNAGAAMDARAVWLESQGWTFKFTPFEYMHVRASTTCHTIKSADTSR